MQSQQTCWKHECGEGTRETLTWLQFTGLLIGIFQRVYIYNTMAGDNLLCGSKDSALRKKKSVFAAQWYGLILLWFRAFSVNCPRGRGEKEVLCCSTPQSMLFMVSDWRKYGDRTNMTCQIVIFRSAWRSEVSTQTVLVRKVVLLHVCGKLHWMPHADLL